jgi:alpha-beta hydrolase superfamily lysophospholipase
MRSDTFTFGEGIFTYRWLPDTPDKPVGVVQIAHGMAEHGARYQRFARHLTKAGYGVYANDHRGHGRTAGTLENVGYFADADGWARVVDDMHQLTGVIRQECPGVPVFLFGHSMGSFLSRTYISRYGQGVSGVVLSATGGDPGLVGRIGLMIARMESFLRGRKARSPLLNALSFGGFNKPFRPNRTDFDWLSSDPAEVDAYIADPYCGGVFTAGFFVDMLTGLQLINRPEAVRRIPGALPVLLLSGACDPVGDNTRGVRQVADSYQGAGIADVTVRFYDGGRHEMLNEVNKESVFNDVLDWLRAHTPLKTTETAAA